MGADRKRDDIVLEFFGRVGLGVGKLRDFSSSVWENSIVGKTMASISPSETSCIISSLLMFPVRSGVLAELKGEFLVDLTYSDSPLLPPKISADVTLLSGLAGGLGDTI